MDQDAFRNLLSAPRPSGSGGSSSSRGVLGAPAPKRGWGLKAKEGHEKKKEDKPSKPEFAPRKYQKRPPEESAYKDRAALRREGRNDEEYENVSKLLEDFEKRKAEARRPEEIEELEKQRAYLGGDVEHSVLVKGLDYALLAARKAELAKQRGEEIDDELDNFRMGMGKKDAEEKREEKVESLGKGFKSIAQKKAEAEAASKGKGEKKKKKKKKVKAEDAAKPATRPENAAAGPSTDIKDIQVEQSEASKKVEPPTKTSASAKSAAETQSDDDEDIFGDAGEYDLGGGAADDDSDDEAMDVDLPKEDIPSRGRSRTRSPVDRRESHGYGPRSPGYRHDRSRSRSYDRRRSRSRSYDRGYRDRSPVYRNRQRSPSYDRRRSPSPYRRRYRDRSYSRSRSRSPYYPRRRSPSPYYSKRRSPSPRRSSYRSRSPPRRRYNSRSPTPRRRTPSPPPKPRERSYTRSPTPLLNAPPRSPSISDDESEGEGQGRITKLQPLSSSAIPSLKSFLQAEDEAAQNEEKRLKKAKWRAQQGLSAQDGASDLLENSKKDGGMGEKQKANREYQILMNRMNKDGGAGGEKSKEE
ncbi:hypothetical protein I302_101068 [Kwoniella bestiolae CBS 10118]|uniref:RED-like N-terminal domain-containing protein n=1 Tax=Kwoniella bestiolae CBS 10118 TaxID=1296100 RepID=A0A1B9G6U7_9TREE|nr:hypothetical protein I302_04444 [Kwoniella bestiolae CBS 10118]OCF26755.1 hypothetical protein I302_04444 [Kwoniella bestiolae CBS 10118]